MVVGTVVAVVVVITGKVWDEVVGIMTGEDSADPVSVETPVDVDRTSVVEVVGVSVVAVVATTVVSEVRCPVDVAIVTELCEVTVADKIEDTVLVEVVAVVTTVVEYCAQ